MATAPQAKPAPAKSTVVVPAVQEPRRESLRDTMESIVFAFILAFLFRTFEAEAFVIPTGSMAPTLYGRHKEADCVQCGCHIVVGASDEYDPDSGLLRHNARLQSALCPNCRFENTQLKDELAFNGDRILVNKFPYEIGEPLRWDVFVFKFPEEPDVNYIKRLVGLPGETIRIRHGDLFRADGPSEQILRKQDPGKQRRLQIPVYDDAHPPTNLLSAGWPERWSPVVRADDAGGGVGGWTESAEGWTRTPEQRVYRLERKAADETRWLRYRHFVPFPADWKNFSDERPPEPKARLISDFCGYNATSSREQQPDLGDTFDLGPFWVGDLTVNFTVGVGDVSDNGELVIEICEGVHFYRARLGMRDGIARIFEINQGLDPNQERELAAGAFDPGDASDVDISFSNADDRLCLWVNDQLVDFGPGAELVRNPATGLTLPQDSDLCPVGIGAQGLTAIVRNLRLERDIYYRGHSDPMGLRHRRLEDLLDSPAEWGRFFQDQLDETVELQVDEDGFLALGDNSPRSRDSREWKHGMQSVPRRHLVGRAFFIYWPHGVPFLNNGRGYPLVYHKEETDRFDKNRERVAEKVKDYPKWTVPFYPQVDRMRRIR
ncbi:MAG: signal peptidase I [Planctomyces sp.]|nr:signal peptidase I [Planctomyces sp.]